ncbi:hypothetical protein JOY44_29930 (plasmid) [Phormidium sp. CLA17]|uniref:hypothetical protein n=1 Tax=Leptolyngbya sp. Cla-17 TaxID=2803751 RepID=UPI001491D034|nr:hypothetical protein [Leptolyngbya sp. Cla-17]MBM0745546.1 hypothetical protein [Leptolyngbya sp. Cla-17]MBM0745642.1 hypothetical protein [Leptolyngbya sp. Cla-17]
MRQYQFIKGLVVLGLNISIGVGIQSSANASRQVIFNESPTIIEDYFGQYWTRLTTTNAAGDRLVKYTYNPGAIRSLFLNANNLRLSIDFVNNRAERIKIHQNGMGFNIRSEQLDEPNYYPTCFNNLFKYIFGYPPSTNSPVYRRSVYDDSGEGGTLHITTHCISEGIAISYEWISVRDFVHFIEIFQEPACISTLNR